MQHEQQRRNEKPTKDPFIKYYIIWPIQNVVESVADFFKWVWRTITGAWWCDHCETYHGRRVHKFTYHDFVCNTHIDKHMCSLGRDAIMEKEPEQEQSSLSVLAAAMKNASDSIAKVFEQIDKDLTS